MVVDEVELVADQGFAQVFFQLAHTPHFAVYAGDIKLVAAARVAFSQGHGLLGLLQQLFGGVAVFGKQRYADGGAQADVLLIKGKRYLQIIQNALGQFGSLVGLLNMGLNQSELITTQARQRTQAAAVGTQTIGQGL